MLSITNSEYELMRTYIADQCGITLEAGKEYLIETRLSDLVLENGCSSFKEFHQKAKFDSNGQLRDRIVDAMTTNETLWFRDMNAWVYIREVAVPNLLNLAQTKGKARVWSAASSTGQEIYSLAILLHEAATAKGQSSLLDKIELLGTDISSSALFLAMAGRYDQTAINRGMPETKRNKYFKQEGRIWILSDQIKKRVKFKKFNLQNSFLPLGKFDLVLCRYVAIYFSDDFKKELFSKIARVLNPGGVLLLGATESLRNHSSDFNIEMHKNCVVNKVK